MCASSTNVGGFRREPGDWPCSQCEEINFKSRTVCRRCATPRDTSGHTGTRTSLQMMAKPGDWTCHECNTLNFAARTTCYRCGVQKFQMLSDSGRPPVVSKPGDWKCPSCAEMNFGSRTVCRSCGTSRPSSDGSAANSNNIKNECVICMENPINTVIVTCGHSAICTRCSTAINTCPICRSPYSQEQIIKVYNVHQ